jgi:glycosyltransferase involved in cell wall biosynthesis
MKPKRIAMVSRRFWPISGPTENFAADLADQFVQCGHEVNFFTAAWQKHWPRDCSFREFGLQRLSRPLSGPWGTYRYQRALNRALESFQPDAVLLFGTGEELASVRKLVGDSIPCVLRMDHLQLSGNSRSIQKNLRLDLASTVICDSLRTRNELVTRKLPLPADVRLQVDGICYDEDHRRTLVRQANSRASLGDAHPVLRIEPAQPLVITGAPMDNDGGLHDLVRAWKIVLESFPRAKLWLLGDGPRGRKIWEAISANDMVYTAIMPGYFDDHRELYQASDLYVHPTRQPVNCHCLLEAIANHVCPLVTTSSVEPIPVLNESQPRTAVIEKDVNGIIAPSGNHVALGEAITMALRSSDLRTRLGNAAARSFRNAIDIRNVAQVFLDALSPKVSTHHRTEATL